MQLPLRFTLNGEDEVKAANFPEIRYFTVGQHVAYRHSDIVEGSWKAVSPDTASWMSAVAYYFARRLQQDIHVPIGLVVDAVGGTPAEAWTSPDALKPLHDFDVPIGEVEKLAAAGAPEYGNYIMHWYDEYDAGLKEKWFAPELDDSDWKAVNVPGDSPIWACQTLRRWCGFAERSMCRTRFPKGARWFCSALSSGWTLCTSTARRLAGARGWRIHAHILFRQVC